MTAIRLLRTNDFGEFLAEDLAFPAKADGLCHNRISVCANIAAAAGGDGDGYADDGATHAEDGGIVTPAARYGVRPHLNGSFCARYLELTNHTLEMPSFETS